MKNRKVPFAMLCCFLIAFVLQVALKFGGVLIFDKALNWEIFSIIDTNKFANFIFYLLINLMAVYFLSFTLSSKPYAKNIWQYIILVVPTTIITILRIVVKLNVVLTIIFDILNYILVPTIINLTTNKKYKIDSKLTYVITIISLQILLYFSYLGLNYWSVILNSIIPSSQLMLYSSSNFLVTLEVYTGLGLIMTTGNWVLEIIERRFLNMLIPINCADDEAKEKELEQIEAKKENKKNK